MLEADYSEQFCRLVNEIDWDIELPIEWKDYFQDRGETTCFTDDERINRRLKVRTHGILWFENSLPFCPRTKEPVGVYTRDFARHGIGFLTPFQIYPEEHVRIVLPTFWIQVEVVRTRRITSKCYEIGSKLIWKHDPSLDAFTPPVQQGVDEPSFAASEAD